MYTNVGAKVKSLANVICFLGIIASVIAGISMIAGGSQMSMYYGGGNPMVVSGLVLIVLGSVGSWASSLALYAFGEMSEHVAAMRNKLDEMEK